VNSFAIKSRGEHLYVAWGSYIMKTDENGEVRELIGQGQFESYSQVVGVALGTNDDVIVLDVYARKVLVFTKG
jgi:hypothetical protein